MTRTSHRTTHNGQSSALLEHSTIWTTLRAKRCFTVRAHRSSASLSLLLALQHAPVIATRPHSATRSAPASIPFLPQHTRKSRPSSFPATHWDPSTRRKVHRQEIPQRPRPSGWTRGSDSRAFVPLKASGLPHRSSRRGVVSEGDSVRPVPSPQPPVNFFVSGLHRRRANPECAKFPHPGVCPLIAAACSISKHRAMGQQ